MANYEEGGIHLSGSFQIVLIGYSSVITVILLVFLVYIIYLRKYRYKCQNCSKNNSQFREIFDTILEKSVSKRNNENKNVISTEYTKKFRRMSTHEKRDDEHHYEVLEGKKQDIHQVEAALGALTDNEDENDKKLLRKSCGSRKSDDDDEEYQLFISQCKEGLVNKYCNKFPHEEYPYNIENNKEVQCNLHEESQSSIHHKEANERSNASYEDLYVQFINPCKNNANTTTPLQDNNTETSYLESNLVPPKKNCSCDIKYLTTEIEKPPTVPKKRRICFKPFR